MNNTYQLLFKFIVNHRAICNSPIHANWQGDGHKEYDYPKLPLLRFPGSWTQKNAGKCIQSRPIPRAGVELAVRDKMEVALDQILLLRSSLLPNEHLVVESVEWGRLIEEHQHGTADLSNIPSVPLEYRVTIDGVGVWIQVSMTATMDLPPHIVVKGPGVSKDQHKIWQNDVRDKLADLGDEAFPIYQLLSLHLLPKIQASLQITSAEELDAEITPFSSHPAPPSTTPFHALLTSHHLISPKKRRSLAQWSSDLALDGFAKIGHPGVIFVQGDQSAVEDFVRRVKAMQWLALRVRFTEPVSEDMLRSTSSSYNAGASPPSWVEVEKVGDVVEEMRKRGRVYLVNQLGIGSAGAK